MNARPSALQATIVKPEQALPIKPFGLEMKVLCTTEATPVQRAFTPYRLPLTKRRI